MRSLPYTTVLRRQWLLALFVWLILPRVSSAQILLNFEGLSDGDLVTMQYPGLLFSNAAVLSAGSSLNELETPPFSGLNVASDFGGPLSILFATPAASFAGRFNYSAPLTLDAFDAADMLVGSATSLFSNNFALTGDAGSSSNELLQVSAAAGIARIRITGAASGDSFTLDDATITPLQQPDAVPEPASSLLFLTGAVLWRAVRRPTRSRR